MEIAVGKFEFDLNVSRGTVHDFRMQKILFRGHSIIG